MKNRNNAYTEVYAILQCVNKEELSKIPFEVVETIRLNRNLDYKYRLDSNVKLKYQAMLPETKAILFNLFRDYLSTDQQKEKIIKMQAEEREKLELKKQEIFKYDDIFKSNKKNNIEDNNPNTDLIEIKKNTFFQKILERIINFFRKF